MRNEARVASSTISMQQRELAAAFQETVPSLENRLIASTLLRQQRELAAAFQV
jgi:hypothetical protein